jgi:hypothetical protein
MARRSPAPGLLGAAAGIAVLCACGVLSGVAATRAVSAAGPSWFGAVLTCIVLAVSVTGMLAYRRCGRSWRAVVISPFSIAAATWLVLFVVRPVELYFSPDQAAGSLAQFGFHLGDLTRAVALGGVGAAAWCVGYLLALGRIDRPLATPETQQPFELSATRTGLVLVAGVGLWLLLFLRQGGVGALVHSAVSIRANQSGSFYGFVGLWIVQGIALYAFAAVLRTPSRTAKAALAAGVVASVLAALALELRGLAVFAALAAGAIYFSLRPLRRRTAAALVVAGVAAVLALGFAQQVRQYTAQRSLGSSIRLASQTPVASMYSSDLSTFDNLVAIQELVPGSIPYLAGSSLKEIPGAVVPRALWPGKPRGIDVRAASYLYPGVNTAIAISLQGELYWNGGVATVGLGALLIGALFGLLAARGLRTRPGSGAFVLYATTAAFTHAFLTRGLAATTQSLIFAVVGIAIAIAAMAVERRLPAVPLRMLRLERPTSP